MIGTLYSVAYVHRLGMCMFLLHLDLLIIPLVLILLLLFRTVHTHAHTNTGTLLYSLWARRKMNALSVFIRRELRTEWEWNWRRRIFTRHVERGTRNRERTETVRTPSRWQKKKLTQPVIASGRDKEPARERVGAPESGREAAEAKSSFGCRTTPKEWNGMAIGTECRHLYVHTYRHTHG